MNQPTSIEKQRNEYYKWFITKAKNISLEYLAVIEKDNSKYIEKNFIDSLEPLVLVWETLSVSLELTSHEVNPIDYQSNQIIIPYACLSSASRHLFKNLEQDVVGNKKGVKSLQIEPYQIKIKTVGELKGFLVGDVESKELTK